MDKVDTVQIGHHRTTSSTCPTTQTEQSIAKTPTSSGEIPSNSSHPTRLIDLHPLEGKQKTSATEPSTTKVRTSIGEKTTRYDTQAQHSSPHNTLHRSSTSRTSESKPRTIRTILYVERSSGVASFLFSLLCWIVQLLK